MSLRIVFRCSFGGEHGWGHIVRCSALACELRSRGWSTILWADRELSILPRDVASSFCEREWDQSSPADVLLIDEMYTQQSVLEEIVRTWRLLNSSGVVVGVDDMQRRCMSGFDLVLNTEIGLKSAGYSSAVSLLGEQYALLRPGFQVPAKLADLGEFDGLIPVLVMVGGTDPFGCLPRVLDALARMDGFSVAPIVVGPKGKDLSAELEAFVCARVLRGVGASELAAWMLFCRLGIIGCGTSLYEAAAMKLPFVGLSIVDNQTATARKVVESWGMPVLHLEDKHDVPLDFGSVLSALIVRGSEVYSEVDTLGASRVADALEILCAERTAG